MSEIKRKTSSKVFFVFTCIFGGLAIFLRVPGTIGAFVQASSSGSLWEALLILVPALASLAFSVMLLTTYKLNHTDSNEIGCLLSIAMLIITLIGGSESTFLGALFGLISSILYAGLIVLLMGYSVSDGHYRNHPAWLIICVCLYAMYTASLGLKVLSMLFSGALEDGNAFISAILLLLSEVFVAVTHLFGFLSFPWKAPNPVRKGRAIVLAVFLGSLGADRFYLGYIGMGFLKLMTGGGFGILWIVDLIRICTGDLKPADGSDYGCVKSLPVRPAASSVSAESIKVAG